MERAHHGPLVNREEATRKLLRREQARATSERQASANSLPTKPIPAKAAEKSPSPARKPPPLPPVPGQGLALLDAPTAERPDFAVDNNNHPSKATLENCPCLFHGFPSHEQISEDIKRGRGQIIQQLLAHAKTHHSNVRNLDTNLHREDFNSLRTLTYNPLALQWHIERLLSANKAYISAPDPSNTDDQWGTTSDKSMPAIYTLMVKQTGYKFDNVFCFDVLVEKLAREAKRANHTFFCYLPIRV